MCVYVCFNLAPISFIISKNEGKEDFMVSVSTTFIGFSVINPKHKKDMAILWSNLDLMVMFPFTA